MHLKQGLHMAYCTNIHRGESWPETFANLDKFTLAVRDQVCPSEPYAIGLRLSDIAARELLEERALSAFEHWLERNRCYVFTINGFPYGQFHGTRVKEQVYRPDWTEPARVEYTVLLFELLARLVPPGVEGSVSTVPCSFKEFIHEPAQEEQMIARLWDCVEKIEQIALRSGKDLHLGLEPEPLCYLETSAEAVRFFERLRAARPGDDRLSRRLGINYDTCHLAVEFEEPQDVIRSFTEAGIRISKLHFSSALKVMATPENRARLAAFCDAVYFHQVVARNSTGAIRRLKDLDMALEEDPVDPAEEWRIHFHIPLHAQPGEGFQSTADHISGVLDTLAARPTLCSHIEMETYTWEVLPPELKNRNVVDQLVAEYRWTLEQMSARGLA